MANSFLEFPFNFHECLCVTQFVNFVANDHLFEQPPHKLISTLAHTGTHTATHIVTHTYMQGLTLSSEHWALVSVNERLLVNFWAL